MASYQYSASAFSESSFNMDALKNFNEVSPAVLAHLRKVYVTLTGAILCAAVGAWVDMSYAIGGTLTSLAAFAILLWFAATPALPANEPLRHRLLLSLAFFQGCSIGPLLSLATVIHPSIIPTALAATSAVFLSFTAAALLARRREFLFLGGLLSSAVSTLLALRFASFFFGSSAALFQVELYVGLLVFAAYIIYDTQLIVERASKGARDPIGDALQLLIDLLGLFVRILVILAKNRGQSTDEERRKKKNGSTSRR